MRKPVQIAAFGDDGLTFIVLFDDGSVWFYDDNAAGRKWVQIPMDQPGGPQE